MLILSIKYTPIFVFKQSITESGTVILELVMGDKAPGVARSTVLIC